MSSPRNVSNIRTEYARSYLLTAKISLAWLGVDAVFLIPETLVCSIVFVWAVLLLVRPTDYLTLCHPSKALIGLFSLFISSIRNSLSPKFTP